MSKEIKKTAIEKEKEKEQERLLSILPMRKHFLKEYFDFLDKYLDEERKPTLKLTEQFCKNNDLDIEKIKVWAATFEAYDDQEILWNIEELYEDHMKNWKGDQEK